MRYDKPKGLFFWLLFLDSILSLSAVLIGQSITNGFDPIFANPFLLSIAALIFALVESYVPFLLLYKVLFESVMKRGTKIGQVTLCVMLFVILILVSLTVAIISFSSDLNLFDVALPVGLAVVNVGIYYLFRIRRTALPLV